MSKQIDTIFQSYQIGGWRDWVYRLFRSEAVLSKFTGTSESRPGAPAPASAMLMASRDVGPLVARTAERLAEWRSRRASRQHLIALDDRQLKDIGISRCDAEQEYRKPFWRP